MHTNNLVDVFEGKESTWQAENVQKYDDAENMNCMRTVLLCTSFGLH